MLNKEQKAHLLPSAPLLPNGLLSDAFSHGSLFSGIGGFDLAAAWMGWNNVFQCEKDEWCRKILAKNFPETKRYNDIKQFNAKEYEGRIDVISGGFPCQPFSVAGKQKGKDDDRYLWEEMLRVVSDVKPACIVGENVTGIIGMALDTVLSDLEAQDYTTETFIIPACGKNAWHKRDRVWIVAYANSIGRHYEQKENREFIYNGKRNGEIEEQSRKQQQCGIGESGIISTNAGSKRWNDRRNNWEAGHFQNDIWIATEDKQEREGRQFGIGSVCSVLSDPDNAGCEEQRQSITTREKFFAPKCSSWWEAEPGMGREINGFPAWLDGNINWVFITHYCIFVNGLQINYTNGQTCKKRTENVLQNLRSRINETAFQQWAFGGYDSFFKEAALQSYLRKFEESINEAWLLLESKEAHKEVMRSLRLYEVLAGSSYRPGQDEQRSGEHSDTLQTLSRFLAHNAKEAWKEYSRKNARIIHDQWDDLGYWEAFTPRVVDGLPRRVDRLKGLGNAIVPQVAFEIFKAVGAVLTGIR